MTDRIRKYEIQNAITEGNYEKAENILEKYKSEFDNYDDVIAILDAGIGEYYEDRARVWGGIRKGLIFNCRNYELYVMLGNYYLPENLYQSYLCYENALYYCDDPKDRADIEQLLFQLKNEYGISVNKTSIIILTCDSLKTTELCIKSIRMTTPESAREIVVVDNGSKDGSVEWLRKQKDMILIENKENAGFSVGCNQGIQVSLKEADILLLNNNTVLPMNALFWLRMGLYDKEENGTAGSVSNAGGNGQIVDGIQDGSDLFAFGEQTNVPMKYPYENKIFLSNFALLIKRQALDKIGMLDESFLLGEAEDRDYGLKVLTAGYKNILCKNSFIINFGTEFDKEKEIEYRVTLQNELAKLNKKWGFHIGYYLGIRMDLFQFINEPIEKPLNILDIGCGCGALIGHIKSAYPNAKVYGIELIPEVAKIASSMGNILCGNVEKIEFPWEEEYFDYVIMGDVLEHLMEPENVLKRLWKHLKKGGHIIVSMPNVKHYSVLIPLLQYDIFPYADAGILDRTHVKMYTGTEIQKLIIRSGYETEIFSYTKFGQPNGDEEKMIDVLNSFMKVPSRESFLAYQYVFKAVKR